MMRDYFLSSPKAVGRELSGKRGSTCSCLLSAPVFLHPALSYSASSPWLPHGCCFLCFSFCTQLTLDPLVWSYVARKSRNVTRTRQLSTRYEKKDGLSEKKGELFREHHPAVTRKNMRCGIKPLSGGGIQYDFFLGWDNVHSHIFILSDCVTIPVGRDGMHLICLNSYKDLIFPYHNYSRYALFIILRCTIHIYV